MTDSFSFNDPRRLFQLWKELTGEDLMPEAKTPVKRGAQNDIR